MRYQSTRLAGIENTDHQVNKGRSFYMKEWTEEHSGHLGLMAATSQSRSGLPGWKRFLDLIIVLLGLPVVLPVVGVVALIIWCVSRGPIFFRQERVGFMGRPFKVWKFRTMHVNADPKAHEEHVRKLIAANLPLTKMDATGDKRLIPFGRVLRASCVDEIPQLINVLSGEMSLVGPRPCMDYEYQHLLPWHKQRFKTPPGMTGLWQVKRGAETSFKEMMQMDLQYVANRTLWLDVSILAATVPAVFRQVIAAWRLKRVRRNQSQSTPVKWEKAH